MKKYFKSQRIWLLVIFFIILSFKSEAADLQNGESKNTSGTSHVQHDAQGRVTDFEYANGQDLRIKVNDITYDSQGRIVGYAEAVKDSGSFDKGYSDATVHQMSYNSTGEVVKEISTDNKTSIFTNVNALKFFLDRMPKDEKDTKDDYGTGLKIPPPRPGESYGPYRISVTKADEASSSRNARVVETYDSVDPGEKVKYPESVGDSKPSDEWDGPDSAKSNDQGK